MILYKNKDNVIDFPTRQETREQTLERLFREYGGPLLAFLRARTGGGADVEDILQEVFLRLARTPSLSDRISVDSQKNKAFLFTVANNLLVDMERHKAVCRRYREDQYHRGAESHELSPEVNLSGIQELDLVEQAILSLPKKWRKAFVMHRFGHMSPREIAKKMNITTRSVENYLKNALIRIRAAVGRATGEKPYGQTE